MLGGYHKSPWASIGHQSLNPSGYYIEWYLDWKLSHLFSHVRTWWWKSVKFFCFFPFFLFPSHLACFLALLSRLPRYVASSFDHVASSPCCTSSYFAVLLSFPASLPCHITLPRCLLLPHCLLVSCYLAAFLPCCLVVIVFCTSWTSPICCFTTSMPHASLSCLPCYLVPYVGWYFPLSFFARRSLEEQALQHP